MAHAFQIDTLAFAKKLQAAGADEQLAEAIVEGITGADTSSLATKEDLAHVEAALKDDISLVKQDIRNVEAALKEDIRNVETALKEDIGLVKEDISKVRLEVSNVRSELKDEIGLVKEEISGLRVDMANMGNAIVYKLGGFLGFLFVVDRLLAFFS